MSYTCCLLVVLSTLAASASSKAGIEKRIKPTSILAQTTGNSSCGFGEFTCSNGSCVNGNLVCDAHDDCGDRSDENGCRRASDVCWPWQSTCSSENNTCLPSYFQCDNGKCISFGLACNNEDNCGDRSDEQRAVPGLKCSYGSRSDVCVLPQRYVNDTRTQCRDETDNCYNSRGQFVCFECFDKRLLIRNTQICDGVIDCHDLSDECLCPEATRPPICRNLCTRPDRCQMKTFTCGNFTRNISDICNRQIDCPDGEDELYCRKFASSSLMSCPGNKKNTTTLTAFKCDGRPECYDLSDECRAGCLHEAPFCSLASRLKSNTSLVIRCRTEDNSSSSLTAIGMCNGMWSRCHPRITEEETNCSARFECKSGPFISIDRSLVCNGYRDCDDGADEKGCPGRFHCSSGRAPVSVPRSFMLDDFWDCDDGSDECPSTHLTKRNFASLKEMIESLFLRVWLWVMAVMAIAGNTFVIGKSLKSMLNAEKMAPVSKSNHFLLLNLGLADFLMGVYLLAIAIQSVRFSGNYCFHDESWRTGQVCQALGVLSVLASEASVMILTVLTAVRLYVVHRPIAASNLKLPYIWAATLLAWLVAVILAVLPVSTSFSDVVTDAAWIPSKFFNTSTQSLPGVISFSDRIGILSPRSAPLTSHVGQMLPWKRLEDFLLENGSGNRIRGLFGYYSRNSVCVSKWFVTSETPGWRFTVTVLSVNLILFLFVASAYLAIYLRSTASSSIQASHQGKRASRMQKKIIRLVVTDFACWVPICVMAFIHFSGAAVLDGVYYVVTAVILLPINSVLNPLLYSDSFEYLWKKSKPLGRRIKQVVCTSPKRDLSAERDLEYFSNKAAKISDKTASVENTNTVITNVSANSTPVLRTKF